MRYWIHRIGQEFEITYALKDRGFLAGGWSNLAPQSLLVAREAEATRQEGAGQEADSFHNFALIAAGDRILVPQYGGEMSLYEAQGPAYPLSWYQHYVGNLTGKWNPQVEIHWTGDGRLQYQFMNGRERMADIGFLLRIAPVAENISRADYAGPKLEEVLRMAGTTADISACQEEIEACLAAWKAGKALNNHGDTPNLKEEMQNQIEPERFPALVSTYLHKLGAASIRLQDSEIIADFPALKVQVFAQARHYSLMEDDWLITQISRYAACPKAGEERQNLYWILSTCDAFAPGAIAMAEQNGVRLIGGEELARLIADSGRL